MLLITFEEKVRDSNYKVIYHRKSMNLFDSIEDWMNDMTYRRKDFDRESKFHECIILNTYLLTQQDFEDYEKTKSGGWWFREINCLE